jgi:uncharacterized membrane protein
LDTTSTSTGSDGKYSLTVDAGVYRFTVKAGGYQDYIETVDLTSGGTFTKDVRLSKVPQSIIQGRVTDSAGNPIPQATVTADGYSAVTDVNGNFVLTVPPKTYTVTVVKSGWRTESASVDASTAGTYTLNFTLTPSQSTIQGTVTDIETGQPIQGATITIDAYSATSNADGSFTLTVPPATYTVTVKKEGYVDWKQTLDVSTPGNYILNVQLTKVKPTINWALIGVGVVLIMVAYAFTRRKG